MPIRKANDLPAIHRYITTHSTEGEAVFVSHSQLPEYIPSHKAGEDGEISLLYATVNTPVSVEDELDIAAYDDFLHVSPGLTTQQGTVLRMIDLKPGKITPMHRTVSFDYGVVLEGEVDLILDSGQTRILHRGDVSVQRGTAHSFRNRSDSQWCRLMFVYMPLQKIEIKGKQLEAEEYEEKYDQEDGEKGEGDEDKNKGNGNGNRKKK
ncbi:hypothetical protein MPDQ_003966 [Monascus purpureus]|uniref:Cupin type-2 domain-containing protein n=1 Tax=Monascus purpureus TaxID=5098 RepID=A0A507R1R7_MONPU|nr:hypothetical protein MPDQ_003966 [Monascus purpureus]BDD63872.1 hypothetical protein MAP00_008729 [Monascus purpureus]